MDKLSWIATRARVIATAALTWLVLAQVAVQAAIDEVGPDLPAGWVEWITRGLAFVGGIVLILRRVTPVDDDDRGLVAR